jgi:hypothetical protein
VGRFVNLAAYDPYAGFPGEFEPLDELARARAEQNERAAALANPPHLGTLLLHPVLPTREEFSIERINRWAPTGIAIAGVLVPGQHAVGDTQMWDLDGFYKHDQFHSVNRLNAMLAHSHAPALARANRRGVLAFLAAAARRERFQSAFEQWVAQQTPREQALQHVFWWMLWHEEYVPLTPQDFQAALSELPLAQKVLRRSQRPNDLDGQFDPPPTAEELQAAQGRLERFVADAARAQRAVNATGYTTFRCRRAQRWGESRTDSSRRGS